MIAAVELAYFASKGRYGAVEDLQSGRFLSESWPRSRSYRIDCAVDPGRGFVCFADPAASDKAYFRVDATQAVSIEYRRRPDGSSPFF